MHQLILYHDYSRKEVHDIFDETSTFTPQAGTCRRAGRVLPYSYLGRLRYLTNDREREQPVYFTWQILDWHLPEDVRTRIDLTYESSMPGELISPIGEPGPYGLIQVAPPVGSAQRSGLTTDKYLKRPPCDYAEQDA